MQPTSTGCTMRLKALEATETGITGAII